MSLEIQVFNCLVCGEATEHWVRLDEDENVTETECTICHEIVQHEGEGD